MKKNMGTFDRIARVLLAVIIFALYFTGQITETTAIVLLAVGVVFALTSALSFCPLYLPLGINTSDKKD